MKNITGLLRVIWSLLSVLDLRDLFVFGGLSLVFYGTYQALPWLSFVVTGAILLALGLFYGRGGDK